MAAPNRRLGKASPHSSKCSYKGTGEGIRSGEGRPVEGRPLMNLIFDPENLKNRGHLIFTPRSGGARQRSRLGKRLD